MRCHRSHSAHRIHRCSESPRAFVAVRAVPAAFSGLALFVVGALAGCSGGGSTGGSRGGGATYSVWSASPQDYSEALPIPNAPLPMPLSFDDRTLRQVVAVSGGGDALRVHLCNQFGSAPVSVDDATIAASAGGSSVDPASLRPLTFQGGKAVTIAAGQDVWSDFTPLSAAPDGTVAVSIHLAGSAPVATVHSLGQETTYMAGGDQVSATSLPVATSDGGVSPNASDAGGQGQTRQSYYWLCGVEARAAGPRRVVVAFGDSITDGLASTVDQSRRWPNDLSRRLNAAGSGHSVTNAGISGNRVLRDVVGPSGVSRFARDALGQTGVRTVIVLLGINDIGFAGLVPTQAPSAEDIEAGLQKMIDAANAAHVDVALATLLPFKGVAAPYFSDAGEAARQALNAWIRANKSVRAVVDFDRVMQSAADPASMNPSYDSGDHLHPNDQGYQAMADAVDLTLFD